MTTTVVLALLLAFADGQTVESRNPAANDEFQKGVAAYNDRKYTVAKEHFSQALTYDSGFVDAHMYLAKTYMNFNRPQDPDWMEHAIGEFNIVLASDPRNLEAWQSAALLYFTSLKYDEARRYYSRLTELSPIDPEPWRMLGQMDFAESFHERITVRFGIGLNADEGLLIDKPQCAELRAKNWDRVEHGIKMMQKALAIRPDYADAMPTMAALYRERADIQCLNQAGHDADVKSEQKWADSWQSSMKHKACAAGRKAFVIRSSICKSESPSMATTNSR
jgi:tetratricopeptide (TPR) repeat protein